MPTSPSIPTPAKQLFTVPEASMILGCSTRKIWQLIATNDLKAVKLGARGTRIRAADLDRFLSHLPSAN